ncbi:hypothetical protein EON63_05020 [archaeon]|nr:MAG: hypothetical protein EON63_05020 [archaeon]
MSVDVYVCGMCKDYVYVHIPSNTMHSPLYTIHHIYHDHHSPVLSPYHLGLTEGLDFSETLTRARFEELNLDLFKKTLGPVQKVRREPNTYNTHHSLNHAPCLYVHTFPYSIPISIILHTHHLHPHTH